MVSESYNLPYKLGVVMFTTNLLLPPWLTHNLPTTYNMVLGIIYTIDS